MTIEGLIGLVDHIKESTAPREERAAVDHLSSALNSLGSSSGDSSGAARAGSEPATLAGDDDGQAAVERRVCEFNSQDCANMAWAFATAGQADALLFAALACAGERRVGNFRS